MAFLPLKRVVSWRLNLEGEDVLNLSDGLAHLSSPTLTSAPLPPRFLPAREAATLALWNSQPGPRQRCHPRLDPGASRGAMSQRLPAPSAPLGAVPDLCLPALRSGCSALDGEIFWGQLLWDRFRWRFHCSSVAAVCAWRNDREFSWEAGRAGLPVNKGINVEMGISRPA